MRREGRSMFLAITFIFRITLKKDTGDVVVIREGEGELLINLTLCIVSRLNAIWARATALTAMYKHSICWEAGSVWEARWRCHGEGGREGIYQRFIKVNTHKLSTTLQTLVWVGIQQTTHATSSGGTKGTESERPFMTVQLWYILVCSCP